MHRSVGFDDDFAIGMAPAAWLGGALGGLVGALGLGALIWLVDPAFIRASIPALYGLEATDVGGWAIHLVHGVVLGLVFAVVITRPAVGNWVVDDVETDVLDRTGTVIRVTLSGFVYGLALWAILPLIVMPLWLGLMDAGDVQPFTEVATETMIGHLLFGTVLGLVYALVVRDN